jgi:hypothetical protein
MTLDHLFLLISSLYISLSYISLPPHLALVLPGISHPCVLNLQCPDIVAFVVKRSEAVVASVTDLADRKDAEVTSADPGYLKGKKMLAVV